MIVFSAKLKLHSAVLNVSNSKDSLLFLDRDYRIYKTNKELNKFFAVNQIFKQSTPHHEFTHSVDVRDDFIALPKAKTRICTIYEYLDKLQIAKRLTWHKAPVSVASFSPCGGLVATGGEDGRAYVYNRSSYNLYALLPPRPDFISSMSFSEDSRFIAYHSYEPASIIYDLQTSRVIASFCTSSVVEDSTFFQDDNEKIFFICKNGDTGIYDTRANKLDIKHSYDTWLTSCALSMDGQFAFVASRANIIYLHRLADNSQVFSHEVETTGICKLRRFNDKLYICCSDGYVYVVHITKFLNEFVEILKTKDLNKACDFAYENNILLKTLKLYQQLRRTLWPDKFQVALKHIQANRLKQAVAIVKPFVEDPVLDAEFKNILKNQELINEVFNALEHKNYVRVYEIVQKMPNLRALAFYKDLEELYAKHYEFARTLLSKDPKLNLRQAKLILDPFSAVPSKSSEINSLLENADKYIRADELAKAMKFKEFYALCDEYPFLSNSKTYKVVHMTLQKLFDKANAMAFDPANTDETYLKTLKYLSEIGYFSQVANNLLKLIALRLRFLELLEKKNYEVCYKFIDENKELYSIREVIELDSKINDLLNELIERAYDGRSSDIFSKVYDLINIEKWKQRVISILKISYIYEMDYQKQKNYDLIDWVTTFSNYVKIFGKDGELSMICNDDLLRNALSMITHDKIENAAFLPTIIAKTEFENL